MYTQNLDEEKRAEFDAMLEGKDVELVALPVEERNVAGLMGAFGMGGS